MWCYLDYEWEHLDSSLIYTLVGVQSFDLLGHVLFQALFGFLFANGYSLAGPLQERALGVASHQPLPERIETHALLRLQMPLDTWGLWFMHWF